jgi:transcriptional regulator with XRE-family HTH domain
VGSKKKAPARKKQIQPSKGLEKQLGEVVREVREEKDISQDGLAREMNTDRTTISLIERGLRSPYIRTLMQIGAALNVPPSEIFRRLERRLGTDWRTMMAESRKRRVAP